MAKRKASSPPALPGYSYLRPLGSGGFADVFLFEQDSPRRVVAVKVLLSDAINPEVLRTFNAEADVMASLSSHPSIVTIYTASISADGRPYLVMEYCPDTMSARYKREPLQVQEVLDIGVRMAAALETAHRSGVLHRDIKPSNILVTTMGSPALADFGIATGIARSSDEPEVFAMSVPWSSPEVISERVSGSVPSEIWSLAATLYTLLAGRSPFELPERARNSRELLSARILKAGYVPIPRADVTASLQTIFARAMDRDPAKRPQSMFEFAEWLRWAQQELRLPVTSLEVAAPEWAAASPPGLSDRSLRGPAITTVNPDSRRKKRAELAAENAEVDRDGLPVRVRTPVSPVTAGLLGAGIGVVALGGIGVALLFALGVL